MEPGGATNPPRLRHFWRRLSLLQKFVLAGSLVVVVGMSSVGYWMSDRVKASVTRNTAATNALYMDTFIAPLLQDLATGDRLTPERKRDLDSLLAEATLRTRIHSTKVWKQDGTIIYSSRPSLVGKRFEPTSSLRRAWEGHVTAEFEDLQDQEDELERSAGKPLLEMYAPIRSERDNRIIAVGEFYVIAAGLKEDIIETQRESWLVVAGVSLVMFASLYGIVRQGSTTIERQKLALQDRIKQLSDLLEQNMRLQVRVAQANRQASEYTEQYLRRIGAELHDGPAQLLSLAILKMGGLEPRDPPSEPETDQRRQEFETVRKTLADSMNEIRLISRNLAIPELEELTLDACLEQAVQKHVKRTGAEVECRIHTAASDVPKSIKLCLFRFVQEGLNNAFRHANNLGVGVVAENSDSEIVVKVLDQGPGIADMALLQESDRLGLKGLKYRVETLLGRFDIESSPGGGTCISARFSIAGLEDVDA